MPEENALLYQEILGFLYNMNRVIRQQSEELDGMGDLTQLQMQALFCVKQRDHVMMSELAAELRVSPGALTPLVTRLVKAGWVERVDDPNDRRAIRLQLTPDSKSKIQRMKAKRASHMQSLFEQLPKDDLKELHRILKKLDQAQTTTTTNQAESK